ncbi:hypothetical protein [Cellulomonas sp. Leaf334]|uniref:hypothetical protein n=1 Tax=Cellulomonas sp. Leaf334 TaxID=1736339 RepID=UPI0006F7DCFF|nr:hypothetical protein [Cellulomonas sp. Leaf334]KQR16368.1 hypothetical protein ASF78_02955 [Cellulomonas sp. Leaf334]
MPRPALRSARARSGLVAAGVALTVGVSAAACSTSAPGQTSPTGSAAALATPRPAPSETLLPETADDAHSAVGELVPGFPATLVPVPDGAEVLLSSAEPVDGTDLTEISLNLRTAQDAVGLLDAVRAPLVAAGFVENAPPAAEPGLAAQSTFSRGDGSELLVVGVLDRDDERTLTLGGRVRAAAP